MKYLKKYSGFVNEELSQINENYRLAKDYMLKRYADRQKKQPNELTPEEQAKALNDKDFVALQKLLTQKYFGYMAPFVKFRFEQKISLEDLKTLLDNIIKYRQLINTLPYPIEKYAEGNPEPDSAALTGFEALMDHFRTFEFNSEGKWIIDALPRKLRDQARALDPEGKKRLIRLGWDLAQKHPAIKKRVISKVARYSNLEDFMKYANQIANADESADKLVAQAESLAPEIVVMYDDDNYVVFSVRTEEAQKKIFRMATWCLNRGSWHAHVRNGVQLNILNFNLPSIDPMYLTGTTVLSNSQTVSASHDINNDDIKKSDDPAEHLRLNGYPEKLIKSVMAILPIELVAKSILARVIETNSVSLKIKAIVSAGHELEIIPDSPEKTQVENDLVAIIDKDFETKNFSTDTMIQAFKQFGILSTFAAKLYNKTLKGKISEDDRAEIFAKTARGFELISRASQNWNDPKTRQKMQAIFANKESILRLAETV